MTDQGWRNSTSTTRQDKYFPIRVLENGRSEISTASVFFTTPTIVSHKQSAQSASMREIHRTPVARLEEATPNICPDHPVPSTISETPLASTVLYLAYGSNMSASTFQGQRGIRPLSAVAVSVPTLRLTFNLPGLPYYEPCFANTALRQVPKIPDKPPLPPVLDPGVPIPNPEPPHLSPWNGGLCGVVYEVTRDDYARIIATEGGGSSYQEIVVPCLALPPRVGIPEKPPLEPIRPFMAHTLWAPLGEDDGEDDGDGDGLLERIRRWLLRLAILRSRPDPEYAQPSARYLALLTEGARIHDLPTAYQDWLESLAPYRVTTCRQRIAAMIMVACGALVWLIQRLLLAWRPGGNSNRRFPLWLLVPMGLLMRILWGVYDVVLKPVFGDGERTENGEEDEAVPFFKDYA